MSTKTIIGATAIAAASFLAAWTLKPDSTSGARAAAARSQVEMAVRRWADSLPREFLDVGVPKGEGGLRLHRTGHVSNAARYQTALLRDLALSLSLTDKQLLELRDMAGVLVPYRLKAGEE